MGNFFWNESDNRLRSFWRVLVVILLYVAFLLVPGLIFRSVTGNEFTASNGPIAEVIRLAAMWTVLVWVARRIDKRSFADYGLNPTVEGFWSSLLFGILLGALLIALVFVVQFAAEWLRIVETIFSEFDLTVVVFLGVPLIAIVAAAIYSQLWFTGYLLTNLAESMGFLNRINKRVPVLAAWLVATLLLLIPRIIEAGPEVNMVLIFNVIRGAFILALAFILTRSLGIPIGLSIGWGFMGSLLFGWKLIGAQAATDLSAITIVQIGPEILTGGDLGPEGGLLAMGAMMIGGAIVIIWTRRPGSRVKEEIDPWIFEYRPLKETTDHR